MSKGFYSQNLDRSTSKAEVAIRFSNFRYPDGFSATPDFRYLG